MFKNLFYLAIFTISCQPSLLAMAGGQNLLSMQPSEFSAGRQIAAKGSKEAKLIKSSSNASFIDPHFWRALYLIKSGVNVNACAKDGSTALRESCMSVGDLTMRLLLKAKADPNLECDVGFAPLHTCANLNHPGMAKLLIKHGANIDQTDNCLETPLMKACSRGSKKIVKILIDAGAKLDEKDHWGQTAIQHAQNKGHTKIVQMLKNAGAQG
ncbi:ankyrin repeat domain-containing protein [Candidatus Dependentiae bacterium]|nr:ankyrin repeat domain-containing protein [Candidatus Dependentiae bacterium]